MTETDPRVSVIVPHYNDLDGLAACLASLRGQGLAEEAFEIIVCDNASPIAQADLQRAVGDRARLVIEPRKGAGAARNAGRRAARGAVLAFIDSDCRADPDWLAAGLAALSKADAAGGQVVTFTASDRLSGEDVFEQVFAFNQHDYIERQGFSVTANLFVPARIFDQVGEFLVGPSEDKEWCIRLRAQGFSLGYAPNAVVHHPTRPDWRSLRVKWERLTQEAFALHRLHRKPVATWLARAPLIAASAAPHSLKILTDRRFTLSQRFKGLVVLWKIRLWRAWAAIAIAFAQPEARRTARGVG